MATVMNNAMLDAILAEVRPLIGRGKVADYIPALASVSGDKLGVAICTVDGQHYSAGDAHERFYPIYLESPEPGGRDEPLSGRGDLAAGG